MELDGTDGIDFASELQCRRSCGDDDEALLGAFEEEKSQLMECFSQLEHRGLTSSHWQQQRL